MGFFRAGHAVSGPGQSTTRVTSTSFSVSRKSAPGASISARRWVRVASDSAASSAWSSRTCSACARTGRSTGSTDVTSTTSRPPIWIRRCGAVACPARSARTARQSRIVIGNLGQKFARVRPCGSGSRCRGVTARRWAFTYNGESATFTSGTLAGQCYKELFPFQHRHRVHLRHARRPAVCDGRYAAIVHRRLLRRSAWRHGEFPALHRRSAGVRATGADWFQSSVGRTRHDGPQGQCRRVVRQCRSVLLPADNLRSAV